MSALPPAFRAAHRQLWVDTDPFLMKRATALPSAHADEPQRLLARLPTVIKLTGLGRSTIYRWIAEGTFPLTCPRQPYQGKGSEVRTSGEWRT